MKTKLHAAAGLTALSLIGISLSQTLYIGGYEIVAEGKVIGFVENRKDFHEITDKINTEIEETYGIDSELESKFKLVEKASTKDDITTSDELWHNISEVSGMMKEAYILSVSGEETVVLGSYADMMELLKKELEKYKIDDGDTDFCESIEYEKKYVPKAKILTLEEAEKYFETNKPLNVKTTVVNEYSASVGFDTVEQNDDTMYRGSRLVLREGVPGESIVTDEIQYMNGEEVSRKTIKEKTVKKPVSEIVSIGTLEPPPGYGTGHFALPIQGTLTSSYGQRWGRLHGGIDLAAASGTPIGAADNGTVIFAEESGSYGLLMKVDHGNGYVTYYAHCSGFIAKVGDCVGKGEKIAYVGNTGNSTGPHCHFEIRCNGERVDPLAYLE